MRAPEWVDEWTGRRPSDAPATFRLVASTVAAATVLAVSGWGITAATATEVPACEQVPIAPGDTLSSIGRAHGRTVAELAEWNGIDNVDLIRAGGTLCLDPPVLVAAALQRERVTECADGPRPGALAFRDAVRQTWPGLTDLGVYNCRRSRGGRALSMHADGRAVDFGLPAGCSTGEGQAIASELVARSAAYGITRVLVCELEWQVGESWSTPSESLQHLHDGTTGPAHIHVELSQQAADAMTTEYVTRGLAPEGGAQ